MIHANNWMQSLNVGLDQKSISSLGYYANISSVRIFSGGFYILFQFFLIIWKQYYINCQWSKSVSKFQNPLWRIFIYCAWNVSNFSLKFQTNYNDGTLSTDYNCILIRFTYVTKSGICTSYILLNYVS